ncbi:hypothetical protein PS6_011848, partial [Mucor atramentarius]
MSSDSKSATQSPGSSSGGSPGADNSIDRVREQVQGIQLDREGHAADSTKALSQLAAAQEDTEMVEAAASLLPRSSSAPPVVNQVQTNASIPLAHPSNSVNPQVSAQPPSVSSSSATSSSRMGNHVDSVKRLIWRRDSLMNLLLDMVESTEINNIQGQQHIVEMRTKVEDMNKLISTLKQSVRLSEANVTAFISGDNEGISLSKQDLPKFQLKSHATRYFPSE